MPNKCRCGWLKPNDECYKNYHDKEWGKPVFDEQKLFEQFCLETQAAGLSWLTVLKKREDYRAAFELFDINKIVLLLPQDIEHIMENFNVIKNKPKLNSIVTNAQLFLDIKKEYGSIKDYFWNKVDNKPIINSFVSYKDIPATSILSDEITKELKKRGFKFIGSVTIYAFLQACGIVNDHENSCFAK